jgi:hypothetical protein
MAEAKLFRIGFTVPQADALGGSRLLQLLGLFWSRFIIMGQKGDSCNG